jgi:hypothetical protein
LSWIDCSTVQRAHHADFVFRVRIAGYTARGSNFFWIAATVRPGLYGHSSRRAAESCPAILVGVNEWQLWQSKTCLTQRGRANGDTTRGVTVIRQPPTDKTARGRKTQSARGLDRLR